MGAARNRGAGFTTQVDRLLVAGDGLGVLAEVMAHIAEAVPRGVLERYQRRTARLAAQAGAMVKELAGRASVRVLDALAVRMSRHTAIRALLRLPVPTPPVRRQQNARSRRSRLGGC